MTETVHFATSDGVDLVGDLSPAVVSIGAAIICHPHPHYGGNRHNSVVQALYDALPPAGLTALRFDFRTDFDGGRGEAIDAIAALDELNRHAPNVPLFVTGYSFGAAIASGLDDPRIEAKVLIAPPLAAMADPGPSSTRGMDVATLILTPQHDQFSPPDATEAIVSDWASTTHETIASTDHFLDGHTAIVAARTIEFLISMTRPTSAT